MFSWLVWPITFTSGIFIFLGLGLVSALSNSVQKISFSNLSKYRSFVAVAVLIILIAVNFSKVFIVSRKYLGAVYYEKGIRAYKQAGDLDKSLAQLNKARQLDSGQDQYFRASSQILLLNIDKLIGQKKRVFAGRKVGS